MEQHKRDIANFVREIDKLSAEIDAHWTQAQEWIMRGDIDKAISVLNAYFKLKFKIEQVEGSLAGVLKGYFADK